MFSVSQKTIGALLVLAFLFCGAIAAAWTGPAQSPPNGNVSAPINVGSADQTKSGVLGVNGLAVFGNTLLSGSSRYLNWGTTAGTNGYGIRDVGGTLEFKNNGGAWKSIATIVNEYIVVSGGEVWTTSGNKIFYNAGNVGIGVSDPTQALHVSGTVLATSFLYSSDARLKKDATRLRDALAKVRALSPVSFTWKDGPQAGESDIGFIAQDVESVVPEIVHTDERDMKSVDYVKLVPILTKAIQEQEEEINSLKARIEALEQ